MAQEFTVQPFPVPQTLDDFNRPDENPMAGDWATPTIGGDQALKIVSGQVAHATGTTSGGTAYYAAAQFSAPIDLWVEIPNAASDQGIDYCIASPNTSGQEDGYRLETFGATLGLWRIDNRVFTQIGSFSLTVGDGDAIGVRLAGGMHRVYHRPAGGSWTLVGVVRDATYTSGYVGLAGEPDTTWRLDNLGVGTPGQYTWRKPRRARACLILCQGAGGGGGGGASSVSTAKTGGAGGGGGCGQLVVIPAVLLPDEVTVTVGVGGAGGPGGAAGAGANGTQGGDGGASRFGDLLLAGGGGGGPGGTTTNQAGGGGGGSGGSAAGSTGGTPTVTASGRGGEGPSGSTSGARRGEYGGGTGGASSSAVASPGGGSSLGGPGGGAGGQVSSGNVGSSGAAGGAPRSRQDGGGGAGGSGGASPAPGADGGPPPPGAVAGYGGGGGGGGSNTAGAAGGKGGRGAGGGGGGASSSASSSAPGGNGGDGGDGYVMVVCL
ncbi:MAG: hypothetical protein QN122_12415 [Armatimonadota bacterium]|nr:hypothetical protein [Armatimonadota bacterium]